MPPINEGPHFPYKEEGDVLGAGHVNDLNQAALDWMQGGGHGPNGTVSRGGKLALPAAFTQRIVIITRVYYEPSDEDDGPDDSSFSSSSKSSMSSSGSSLSSSGSLSDSSTSLGGKRYYECRPRYYSHEAKQWFTNTEDGPWDLDADEFPGQFRVGDRVEAWWDPQREAYIARPMQGSITNITTGGGDSTSTVSGTCCCDELDCLKPPKGFSGSLPVYAYVPQIVGFRCDCKDPDDPANTHPEANPSLTQVDPDDDKIWKSKVILCRPPAGTSVPCTVTTPWIWNSTANDWLPNGPSTPANCTSCTAAKPLANGTVDGQTTTTQCTTTRAADGTADYLPAYWLLTIAETLDANGCDATKVEFHIG